MSDEWQNGDVVVFTKTRSKTNGSGETFEETYVARRDCKFGSEKEQWSTTCHGFWRPSDEEVTSYRPTRLVEVSG